MLEAKLDPQTAPGLNQHSAIRFYELERYCMERRYFGWSNTISFIHRIVFDTLFK